MINFTIILADDEQQILYGMKNGIDWESLGFSVVGTAQNGKEALELIEEYHPDLLISDIKMPFMDGLELSKTIHENYINTKIILFSGWDDFEYARTAISYGVSQYIMKPIGLLSGGQRQAASLLMATIAEPELLLLDEHTAALDPGAAEKVMALTKKIVEENKITTLMITHDMEYALEYGSRTIMLDSGKIVMDLTGKEREEMTTGKLAELFYGKAHKRG